MTRLSDGALVPVNMQADKRKDFGCPCFALWRDLVRDGRSGWVVIAEVDASGVVGRAHEFPPY